MDKLGKDGNLMPNNASDTWMVAFAYCVLVAAT